MPQQGRRVPCRASQPWVPLLWVLIPSACPQRAWGMPGQWGRLCIQVQGAAQSPLLQPTQDGTWDAPKAPGLLRLLHFTAFKQESGQGSCSLSAQPQLSCPDIPGDGANHPCSHPVSPRAAHTPPLMGHRGEALEAECPVPPGGLGIRGGTGVCRCRAPAAHACGKGSAPASPGWNLGVSSHFLPLPFPAAGARGLRAMGWPSWPAAGLGGCASQPRREMGYNQSWKRFPAEL